jgi:hypothetical protein
MKVIPLYRLSNMACGGRGGNDLVVSIIFARDCREQVYNGTRK